MISALRKRSQRALPLLPCEGAARRQPSVNREAVSEPGSRTSPDTGSTATLSLDWPASRAEGNK